MDSEFESMPYSEVTEKWILSAIFQNHKILNKIEMEGIDEDCFHAFKNLNIFKVIKSYLKESPNKDIDLVLFVEHLTLSGKHHACGGLGEITSLLTYAMGFEWTDKTIERRCEILREFRTLRLAKTEFLKINDEETPEEVIASTESALKSLRNSFAPPTPIKGIKENLEAFLGKLSENIRNKGIIGLSTGIPELDHVSGGLKPGELWTICGKPSQGKSVLMLQMALEVAFSGKKVAFFTLEMMTDELCQRMISTTGNVDMSMLTSPGKLIKAEMEKIKNASLRLKEISFTIIDTGGMTIEKISAQAGRIQDLSGLDLLVVDYLQLIKPNGKEGRNREQEVASFSSGLKELAKRLKIPVITGSQLNDDGKTRESRAIEQDSDALIGVDDGVIKVGKMRNGRRGDSFKYALNGEHQKFVKTY
jgi:replicative DNA helicase